MGEKRFEKVYSQGMVEVTNACNFGKILVSC